MDGTLIWYKNDDLGNLLGGATFKVCRTHDYVSDDGSFVEITPVCVEFVDNNAPDIDPDAGEFKLDGLVLGRYTVQETVPPAGYTGDLTRIETVDLTTAEPSLTITLPWVNTPLGEGCTPGFWKNHVELWDENADDVSDAVKDAVNSMGALYQYNDSVDGANKQLFRNIFGLTEVDMDNVGLNPELTMEQAINLGGGRFKKLARHGVAGLLNAAASGIDYAYETDEVLTMVNDAIVSGNAEPTAENLADENEKLCPLG